MGGKSGLFFKNRVLSFIFLCFISSGLMISSLAFAQNKTNSKNIKKKPGEFTLQEVVVTGSRIVRNNNKAVTPIVTLSASAFEQSSTSAIETQLDRLPQFAPTVHTPTFGGDIQPTARSTPGSATVALRGLGSNRDLVLINGRRGTPANAMGVIDINTIPAAAIKYVEFITGGASATYGADAISGVINFIMNDDFEGFQFDAQAGETQEGDNFEYKIDGIAGGDINGGRGHVVVAFSHNQRNDAMQIDRSWYRKIWADPHIGSTIFFPEFDGFNTGYGNLPNYQVVNSVIKGATFTSTSPMSNITFYDDGHGNIFSGFDANGIPGESGANIVNNTSNKLLANGQFGMNFDRAYLIFPLKRSNLYTSGSYKLNDYVSVFGQGYFNQTHTLTIQSASPITGGWGVTIDPTINHDDIPAGLLAILNSRQNPDAPFTLRAKLPIDRGSTTDVYTYNMVAGLKGTIPKLTDWTWTAYVSQGQAETNVLQKGFASLQRVRDIMTSGPDFGKGFDSSNPAYGNYSNQAFGGFGASVATCKSGLNPFDWGSVTQDCWDAIKADIKTRQVMKQTIWEGDTQGPVVELPAGELRTAIGASYRKNEYFFENDTINTKGTSFIEQALGLYPAGDSSGEITAKEVYGELLVPVVSDLPFVKKFDLELGARRSKYDTTGVSWTYKALADWRTNSWLRFRGGYNRAERSPNIAELYLAPEQTFAYSAGGDVCSTRNLQPWSANKTTDPQHWQDVVNLCGKLMQRSGDPNADTSFYGVTYQQVASGTAPTNLATQTAGGAFLFPSTVGNPDLKPEKADTWTAGVVIDSPIHSIMALSSWRVSIDYYSIKVKDAIGQQSADVVMQQCTSPEFNPTFDPNSPYCVGFNRDQTGAIGQLETTFFNNGRFQTSGIDIQLNWGMELGPGRIGVNSMFNYLIDMKTSELPTNPLVDYAGTFGPTENGLNGNSYRWRLLSNISYQWDNLRLAIRWQHLPSIKAAASATVATTITGAPSYDLFDLLGNYNLTSTIHLRFGCENIFNKEPPLTNVNPDGIQGMTGGAFSPANYDTNGRRFYAGARWYFGS